MPAPSKLNAAQRTFMAKAPGIMRKLMRDFPKLQLDDAAAILGNLGHECNGFTKLQEMAPTVKGSRQVAPAACGRPAPSSRAASTCTPVKSPRPVTSRTPIGAHARA